jgi:hypothetical protein
MGASQANFIILEPGADKEVAVLLNDPAAAFLAQQLGAEPTAEWREAATRATGEAVIRSRLASGEHLDSLIMVSAATFQQQPDLLAAVRMGLAAG